MREPRPRRGATRRQFLEMAGVAGLAAGTSAGIGEAWAGAIPSPRANPKKLVGGSFRPGAVRAKGRVIGANDRVLVGHVGVGRMGGSHFEHFVKNNKAWNVQSIAVCDVYDVKLEARKQRLLTANPEVGTVQADRDYRRLLDNKDIDAIVIGTPEHWHAQIAVHALQAGKHLYLEKPISRYLDEGLQVYDAWKRSGKVVQVGSQACSDQKYHAAREVVAADKLGPIVSVQTSYTRNSREGEWNYEIDPNAGPHNLDWETWQGSAPRRPWNDQARERFFRFRKYRDYSAGILTDLMPHRIHAVMFALGGRAWPLKVQCIGTRNISTDRDVSDTVHVTAEMEGGWTFLFVGSTVNEKGLTEQIRGNRATLYLAGNTPEVKPERPFAEELDGGPVPVTDPGMSTEKHEQDWIESIRAHKQPNCDLELAIRAQTVVSLAEISETTGKTALFDPARRRWKLA